MRCFPLILNNSSLNFLITRSLISSSTFSFSSLHFTEILYILCVRVFFFNYREMSGSESVIMNYFYYYYYNYNNWFQRRNERWLKIGMGLCGLCLVGYIVGPPLYYHLSESLSTTAAAAVSTAPVCRPCFCDCSSQPLLSLHEGYFFYFLSFIFFFNN